MLDQLKTYSASQDESPTMDPRWEALRQLKSDDN